MRPAPRPGVGLAAAAAALVLPLMLAACGESGSDGDEDAESSDTSAHAEGTASAETDTNTAGHADTDAPETYDEFPSDVPLADGEVEQVDLGDGTGGRTGGSGMWAVVVVEGTEAETYAEARDLLTGAGYDVEEGDVENSGLFRNDTWTVAVSVFPWEQGKVGVEYSVLSAEVY